MFKHLLLSLSVVSSVSIAGPVTSVICSTSAPRAEGFELVRVTRKKDRGEGSYRVSNQTYNTGGVLFKGTYDVQLRRLKAKAVQVDEDGEEGQFVGSVDAVVSAGEHLRVIFANPAGPEKAAEQIEFVCNVVTHSH